jgi:anti-sigma regulatory factor (Ser/Thr protein kinase)
MAGSDASTDLDLEFPPRPEYVRLARHAVGALARRRGLPGQTTMDLELAASEACTMAMADSDGVETPIRLVVSVAPTSVEMQVHHAGPDLDASLDPDAAPFERTLSLAVIRGLVDEIHADPWPDGGGISYRIVVFLPVTG